MQRASEEARGYPLHIYSSTYSDWLLSFLSSAANPHLACIFRIACGLKAKTRNKMGTQRFSFDLQTSTPGCLLAPLPWLPACLPRACGCCQLPACFVPSSSQSIKDNAGVESPWFSASTPPQESTKKVEGKIKIKVGC